VSELSKPAPLGVSRAKSIAVQKLSTQGLLPRSGIEYWNDIACSTFTQLRVDPLGRPFRAELSRANVGDMRVAVANSTGSIVTRSSEQVARSRQAYFLLHLQLGGVSLNRQDGREIQLARGDFAIFDSTRPYQVVFEHDTSILVLRIAQPAFRSVIPCAEAITLVPLSGRTGPGRLAAVFIHNLWLSLQQGIPSAAGGRLCRPVLDVVAAAYATVPAARVEGTSLAGALRVQIHSFIEQHLGDQELNVASIATAFGISCRYVHALFKGGRDTVSEYIQSRRLDEAAKTLADRMSSGLSIGRVAFAHGFKSQAHFGRLFREHYGMTPGEYRHRSHG
jgi:AraC-like DNA-binding protein